MTWDQPQGQQQYPYNYQGSPQYQQPVTGQYPQQGYPPQGYPQQYYPQQQPYGQPGQQQVYYPPKPGPPPPNPLMKFLPGIICCVILFIALIGIVLVSPPSTKESGPGNIRFINTKVNYYKKTVSYYSVLDTIAVTGNVTNIGKKDIKFSNIKFSCNGAFLTNAYFSTLEADVLYFDDTILSPNETVPFKSSLGTVTSTVATDQTTSPFYVLEGNKVSVSLTINVGPFYK